MRYAIRCFLLATALCPSCLAVQIGGAADAARETRSSQPAEEGSDAAAIRVLEHQVEEAIVRNDPSFLEKVLADDFTYARTTGEVDNKMQWLQTVARRPFIYRKIVSVDIEIHGDVAVTHGSLDMAVHDEHGGHANLVKYLHVYEHRNGQWLMLAHRSLEETAKSKS